MSTVRTETSQAPVREDTDPNTFDRCFFNGFAGDGSEFFACALGVYPGLGIADAAFCVVVDGVQHNVRTSRHLDEVAPDCLDSAVGPIRVAVDEATGQVRILVAAIEGVTADLVFTAIGPEIEEPRFHRPGPDGPGSAPLMDYVRLTQHGVWSGTVTAADRTLRIAPQRHRGVRDHSQGVRPLPGARQQSSLPTARGFSWLWAPVVFPDRLLLVDVQGDPEDPAYHRSGTLVDRGTGRSEAVAVRTELTFRDGDPHATGVRFTFDSRLDGPVEVRLRPLARWSMSGVGYQHPVWGFGMDHGAAASAVDAYDLAAVDWADPLHRHTQALSAAAYTSPTYTGAGTGCVEQLFVPGPLPAAGILDVRTEA